MIKLLQPSLALHSHDVPDYRYKMKQTWNMPKGASVSDVVYWILYAHDETDYGLHNVVINCHGFVGGLLVGGDGQPSINTSNVGMFSQLRKKSIGTIWLVACEVAKGAHGAYFCEQMAREAGCNVVAANNTQTVNPSFYWRCCPKYCIDDFEGLVRCWDSTGACKQVGKDADGVTGLAA